MKSKKYLIVLILRILETHSDKNHPLTQIAIAKMISDVYDCDRKTVGRNIKFLTELGYTIKKTPKGFYMEGQAFSREEIQFISGLIKASELSEAEKEDLNSRVRECLSRYYIR